MSAQVIQLFTREVIAEGSAPEVRAARETYWADPTDRNKLVAYAEALVEAREWESGRAMFNKASELDPSDWRSVYNEGCCYCYEGEWFKAQRCLGRALSLAHRVEDARDITHNIRICAKKLGI